MPYGIYAECPHCKIKAHGEDEITKVFGYRTMATGQTIPQSYCRKCRTIKNDNKLPYDEE